MCMRIKETTPARVCVGKAGTRLKTDTLLKFRADHAVAMDAVWSAVDEKSIDELNFLKIQTVVTDKEEYITRPDFGRKFSKDTIEYIKKNCIHSPEVQIIAGDGLSSTAINANLRDIYSIILDGLEAKGYKVGTPIFIKFARVATMDRIGEALNAKITIILIGERPGLATGESMSCYMAYESSTKKPESQRTVISNIHRNGMPPVEAGAQIVDLIQVMLKEKKSGVDLKI
ncbi:ethanolamine ammonia-lyase light chain [Clostridium pasteurianum DSM 525 = ATCC 6013]|uniref:Ethanolamine ammonia-lyase small subunit n=2 Tax=Clostridium pasteurianum TaxID=1501 RepID=A0A0H3J768_CLOPA|nr:ethanolamine ammonia-lyase light chain [Clostridium pasteurianum DSM 525 = ATCC 6013]AOZ81166.1 ethanolamine ammonia-lyase light chain [Clostridium pasteurianum]AJA53045.1 ethanolamine ammonia-lyase light chain [Clostridium pasteurianum DSM 525 = ATCC 6013]AOZ77369.1 ethanolamine ammonia-lyase light chain [Clostridium pasteurianum DSM 525 = ATCC 6013]KRU10947.1 Ethanolamine ammonia-lyase light chain [Clostridium pasteurianum DSM 525 = ATCC 6013]